MPRFSQVSEDFDIVDLLRAVPSAVAYTMVTTCIPAEVRHELCDMLTLWEDENSCEGCEAFITDPERRLRPYQDLCIECEEMAIQDDNNNRRYAAAKEMGALRVI